MTSAPERPGSVLLLHGFASSVASSWVRFGWIDALRQQGWEPIAPDLPGHGDAPKPDDPVAYAPLEKGVRALIPSDGPASAVGFSLGARLVLGLEVDRPGTFERIVIAGVGANLFTQRTAGRGPGRTGDDGRAA